MAHLAPAWPDQVLCKENKRRALAEQQRKWMEQRQQALSQPTSQQSPATKSAAEEDDLESLEEMNGFLAGVSAKETGLFRFSLPHSLKTNQKRVRSPNEFKLFR